MAYEVNSAITAKVNETVAHTCFLFLCARYLSENEQRLTTVRNAIPPKINAKLKNRQARASLVCISSIFPAPILSSSIYKARKKCALVRVYRQG